MILVFQQLRVLMRFCFAEWRKAALHGKKPTRLIELEGHMLTDPPPNHKTLMLRKNQVAKIHLCPVGTSKRTLVLIKMITIPVVVHSCTSVASATPRARLPPTHPKIVVKQKTIRALQKCSARYRREQSSKSF